MATLAAWTGGATATSSIAAGTVAIGVGATGGPASANYPVPIDGANWYPGMSKAVKVTVKNTGTLAAPYSPSGSWVESGAGKLDQHLAVKVTGGTVSADGRTYNDTAILTKAANGNFGTGLGQSQLVAGGEQALCIEYSLPGTPPSSLQGNSATITLTFTATVGVS